MFLFQSVVSGESEPDTFHVTRQCDKSARDVGGDQLAFSIEQKRIGNKQVQYKMSGTVLNKLGFLECW